MYCRFWICTRTHNRTLFLVIRLCALAFLLGALGVPARADEGLASRVRAVLAAHCALCRDISGGTAIDLAKLARDPNAVRPGNPDGSPVYTALLRRIGTGDASPGPDDLATLRTWIESLPPAAATCPSARFTPRRHIEAALSLVATRARKPIAAFRILSLAHLDLGCASVPERAAYRQLLEYILAARAGIRHPIPTHALDAETSYLAVDIQDLGWDAAQWRTVLGATSHLARTDGPRIVRADVLVAQVLRGTFGIAHAGAGGPVPPHLADDPRMQSTDRDIARRIVGPYVPSHQLERYAGLMIELARQHLAPLNLHRVAAELEMPSDTLANTLEAAASGQLHLLRRLVYGTVLREDIEDSWVLIGRLTRAVPPARAMPLVPLGAMPPPLSPTTPIELTLYPDLPVYLANDTMKLTLRSNVDCRLTVISIDAAGFGTVIFPNDFESDNRILAHLDVSLPALGARYRFRLKDKGRERVVATCTRSAGAIDGIRHDFERHRFQELGPYSTHMDNALKQAANAGAEPSESAPAAIVPQREIWRTGIVIEVQ